MVQIETEVAVLRVMWGGKPWTVMVSNHKGVAVHEGHGSPNKVAVNGAVWIDPYDLHNQTLSENPEEPALLVHAFHSQNYEPVTLRVRTDSVHLSNDAGGTLSAEENCNIQRL